MSKRILIVTGDSGECYETLYACHRFQEAGMTAVLAGPTKKRLHLVMHDFEPDWDTYIERPGYCVQADIAISEANVEDFDAILIIGGRAPEFLRHNKTLIELVRLFAYHDKWVFSICHGIQVLITAGVVKGRRVTCYEHVQEEVIRAGGNFEGSLQAVRDGKIITAQTWQSHPDFYREIFCAFTD